ncbi:hypothetical protein EZW88_23800 [Salmonella enterica subsp. enterica serovar Bredeney]|nr:hypothetical protein [Salmonella enterica subsp. enterica serovar Bredeney]EDO5628555.1 hypothetical protein [Salmonella enterica]EDR9399013.1 hypothetical protein [Salmonella enterica subsp. enterica]EDT6893099.1 hypothetical protein [Salmonella enterica subsp. enterica serovar Javiana]EHW1129053.1 hypothetical protein [Salmonella enterica subsp. enterica serovar Kinondoni]HCM6292645.1 hypothetical protein [Salmonella enterica subsp. enterica serovar 16:l,v:-]
MNTSYHFPYGQYGELYTRGPWLPSSIESAFSAEVARDELNLQNQLFKVESIYFNPSETFNECCNSQLIHDIKLKNKHDRHDSYSEPHNSSAVVHYVSDFSVDSHYEDSRGGFFKMLKGCFCCG